MPGAGICLPGATAALALRPRIGRHPRQREAQCEQPLLEYPYKLAASVISGAIAGLAGFLFAIKDGYVNPELLGWHLSGSVLIMISWWSGHLRGD